MKIDNEFSVGVPIDQAWTVLTDLVGIAPCLPGAVLTGVEDETYSGKVKIKVGPVVSEYAGTARFREMDVVAHHAIIDAKGKDSRGSGNASAAIDARLQADGVRTIVTVSTDLTITGKIAQFGSGVNNEVSARLLGQFAENLEARLLAPESVGIESSGDSGCAPASAPPHVGTPTAEPAPLDLMAVAGASVYKRLAPVAVGLVAVIVLLLRRRGR